MTIQHGTTHTSYSTKAPGHDLRDTAVGGAIRHGNPEAVTRFRQILAARDAHQRKAPPPTLPPKAEEKPAAPASRKHRQARRRAGGQARHSDDLLRKIHAEYWNGLDTITAVCERWGVSFSTLDRRWQRLGLPKATGLNRFVRQPKETS